MDIAIFLLNNTASYSKESSVDKLYAVSYTHLMAVSVITMIIPLALYLIFQRYIINTFAASGVKG